MLDYEEREADAEGERYERDEARKVCFECGRYGGDHHGNCPNRPMDEEALDPATCECGHHEAAHLGSRGLCGSPHGCSCHRFVSEAPDAAE